MDRNQLAQSLEYAGWARSTSLDELAGIYYGGAAGFWDDWKEFTGSDTPVLVSGNPRLVLVARSFDGRTFQALEFLLQHRLPVQVLKVAFYIDDTDRRFLNVEWESEPEAAPRAVAIVTPPGGAGVGDEAPEVEKADFRQVSLADVLPLIDTPAALVWRRPRKGQRFEATLLESGRIRLADGREFRTPSAAAMAAADVVSYDGWYAWRLGEDGPSLNDFRHRVADASTAQGNVEIEITPSEATPDTAAF